MKRVMCLFYRPMDGSAAYLIAKSDSLDMGLDMTNGTGWPFGGPILCRLAAAQLLIQDYMMTPAPNAGSGSC